MAPVRRFALRLLSVFRLRSAETDLAREIQAHLQLLEDQFVADGMSENEARYAARRAFGGVEQVKERQRDARSFRWLAGWWMDLKLGGRMLVKFPGLTIVGGLAITVGIAFGAAAFEVAMQLVRPTLPLEDGARIVGLRLRDTATGGIESRVAHDVAAWGRGLSALEDVGAYRTVSRNLATDGHWGEPVAVAEISASGFRIARVPARLGRVLTEADERSGAAPVVVIGDDLWRARFDADPAVLGRAIRLGAGEATIVGVMPPGFAFPVDHGLWAPLGEAVLKADPLQGPELRVFARLAQGQSVDAARAELLAAAHRTSAASPGTHAHLRPEILPFARSILDISEISAGLAVVNVFVVMFVLLIGANVAALVFARALTRQPEIAVRTALGASRARIVAQLFTEALVLGGGAALAGLAGGAVVLRWWFEVWTAEAGGRLPFWLAPGLSWTTVMYAGALVVLCAIVSGALPALRVTGRRIEGHLREASVSSTPGFGRVWTLVIVAQVAVTVAFPATAFFARQYVVGMQSMDPGFSAGQYLSARLETDDGVPPGRIAELQRRFEGEPGIVGVTFANPLPRTTHREYRVELDGDTDGRVALATQASVALNYFEVLDAPILSGRGFHSGDIADGARTVIVNESFVRAVAGGREPVGLRVRQAASAARPPGPWHEIVGVVRDLGMVHDDPTRGAGMYYAADPAAMAPRHVIARVAGDPLAHARPMHASAAAIDPGVKLHDLLPLDQVGQSTWLELNFLYHLLILVSALALLLSLAGVYSVMSFTVSRRTREIGIRVALGAQPALIVTAILKRSAAHVALGILAGGVLVMAMTSAIGGLSPTDAGVVCGYLVLMLAVCLAASIVPARRALAIQPTEALREG